MQQEYLAKPRLLAISEIDRALNNCRRVLAHSRAIGLPVAFIRMLNESAFFNRATPFVRWIDGFEPYRNEMVFERNSPSCYSCEPFAALLNQCRGGFVLAGFAGDWFGRRLTYFFLCVTSIVAVFWLYQGRSTYDDSYLVALLEAVRETRKPEFEVLKTISVPAEIYGWKAAPSTRERAREIQERNRKEFLQAFSDGLAVLGYERDPQGAGKFLLGRWEESWLYPA